MSVGYGQFIPQADPQVQRAFEEVWTALNRRLKSHNLDIQEVAREVGRVLRWGQVTPLRLLTEGEEAATWLQIHQMARDQYALHVTRPSITGNSWPVVGVWGNNSTKEVAYIEQEGDGKTLYLKGLNGGNPVLYLEKGSGTGYVINTNIAGCYLTNGGTWQDACTRRGKTVVSVPDKHWVAGQVQKLPVSHWQSKQPGAEEHISPMAEDFKELFRIGDGEGICPIDLASVSLIAVQSLQEKVQTLEAEVTELRQRVQKMEQLS